MSKRIKQVNELIRSSLGRIILEEIEMPNNILVTVVKVETSPDLKHARIFISVVPDNKSLSTIKLLRSKKGKIQHELGKNIVMKFTPKISFTVDYTEREASKIDDILDNL